MNHGDHGGHDMPMKRCSMNMLWYALTLPLIYLTADIYIYIPPKII